MAARNVPWDRWLLAALLAVAVVVSDLRLPTGGVDVVRVGVQAAGIVLVIIAIAWMAVDVAHRHSHWRAVIGVAGCVLYAFSAGLPAAVWVPFLGVAWAAGAALPLPAAVALAALPAAAVTVRLWQHADPLTVLIDLGGMALVFLLVQMRRRSREEAEFARAQAEVIKQERDRSAAVEHRREVAAQVHDVLAHTLSGLIVTLQGASVVARRDGASPELTQRLDDATALAKEGLAGARQAVEALHSGHPADDLGAWLDSTLARLRRSADLDVTVTGTVDDVPHGWRDLCRSVLTESLTNAIRHAPGAPVVIRLTAEAVTVRSGPARRPVDPAHRGSGHGLAGLQERVIGAGGRFRADEVDDGFEVRMSWPGTEVHGSAEGS